jgi:hypothetical protein
MVLGIGTLLALLFRALGWPVLFGVTLGALALFTVLWIFTLLTPREPVVILSQLPDELREPLEPFIRRGTEKLAVSEIRRFYRAAGELMEDRAELARHQADLINAATAYQLAASMAEFVNGLSAEERALQEYRRQDGDRAA